MDMKSIRELVQKFTQQELLKFADDLENTGSCAVAGKEDPGELMSDLLQAAEVRGLVDGGMPLPDAIREFSRRVRGVLS